MKPLCLSWTLTGVMLVASAYAATAFAQVPVGTVIYDFDTGTTGFVCDPDDWTFFGNPTTDFGSTVDVEDGHGVFHAGDWTLCEQLNPPSACQFMGSIIGIIRPCTTGQTVGVADADLDLSLGTGLSVRVRVDWSSGFGGTPGARVSLELRDDDGTNAVVPGLLPPKPYVNRMIPLTEQWVTLTFPFAGLDFANDDAAEVGGVPGLDLANINDVKLLWRRFGAEDQNVFLFDNITLVGDAPKLWADADDDGDVGLDDYAALQRCFGADLTPTIAEDVLFDFESGEQGWQAFGVLTTDSGVTPNGSFGQGRFQVGDFDADTSGLMVSVSPDASTSGIDLSEYIGLKLDMRLLNVIGETPFAGTPEVRVAVGHGEAEFAQSVLVTDVYDTYTVMFADMTPTPTPADLAHPDLEIKLVMFKDGNTGVAELNFDEVTGIREVHSACEPLDSNYDGVIDLDDFSGFADCMQGVGVTDDFFPYCY